MLTHEQIEKNAGWLIVLTVIVISFGGALEIVPLFFQKSTTQAVEGVKPYDPVRLAGRDVYIREGCYNCHSQMVRPFRAETERYGHYSVAGEFVYDHPFQWGSKRTGPDLARVGERYSNEWHVAHLNNPRDVVPESNMPAYPFLAKSKAKDSVGADIEAKMRALRKVGVPYTDAEIAGAKAEIGDKTELDVLIAYLQGMGTALKNTKQGMDINDLRSIVTVLAFVSFVGIVWWAYGKGARKGFDEAANLPFADDDAEVITDLSRKEERKTS